MDDIILNKVATIEKCLTRIKEEAEKDWKNDFTIQDALILNLERACQATIDLATHVVRIERLGIPKYTRHLFDLLREKDLIKGQLSEKLKNMVGFRNLAVHDYGNLNLDIVESIVKNNLKVFSEFCKVMIQCQKG